MWQGWSDNGIPPSGTVDYYDVLAWRMGGLAATKQFARLFMEPTVYHCGGGYAKAVQPDLILPMVEWVESGTEPGTQSSPLTISYTIPTSRTGLPTNEWAVIQNAWQNGVRLDIVQPMVFDYYDHASTDMGDSAITAVPPGARASNVLHSSRRLRSSPSLWRMCPSVATA